MALTCGFYNAMNHDRRYDARQFARIFDGIISDGIYATIGDCFVVKAQSGRTVTIGTGRAWFNGTWTLNDALLPLELPLSDVVMNRMDAIVLEVDTRDSVRNNTIKVITGTPSNNPAWPTLDTTEGVYQYPLCYVYRSANSATVTQSNIQNRVGSSQTPFVTGILQTITMDKLLTQWEAEFDEFMGKETIDFKTWSYDMRKDFEEWLAAQKLEFGEFQGENQLLYQEWLEATQNTFNTWLGNLQSDLSVDAAGKLQVQIQASEIRRILAAGFVDGTKTFSDDGRIIISTASNGATLTKTFSEDFDSLTVVLKSPEGGILASQIKVFDPSGKLITTSTTFTYGRSVD